jgi:drug/metabolite transporter (DMT)-like permease
VALVLYYLALGHTPASRATLAELAFPITAAIVGIVAFATRPTATQWTGLLIVLVTVVALALHERRSSRPAVAVPSLARAALGRRTQA